jgi:hypothetical protein
LLRLFVDATVDPAIFEDQVMQSFMPQAQLADLCDGREAPVWKPQYFNPTSIHAVMVARATAAIAEIGEADRPDSWLRAGEQALAADVETGWGLFFFAATPFSELGADWPGLTLWTSEDAEESRAALQAGDDVERSISDLFKMSIAFEIPTVLRSSFAAALPPFIEKLENADLLVAFDIVLQLAARWRDLQLSDSIVDIALSIAREKGLMDAAAAPRLIMLAAAAESDRSLWLRRVGNLAQSFAFAQKAGPPSINLMRALELLRDFEPDLGPTMASARSYTSLAYDRLPNKDENEPGD